MRKEIKKLELKKIFKEFGYLKIDGEYKNELLNAYGPEFSDAVRKFFKDNPDADLLFNNGKETQAAQSQENSQAPVSTSNSGQDNSIKMIGTNIYDPTGTNTEVAIYTGQTEINSPKIEEKPKSEKLKKLYRKIANKTHPDKVHVKYLNELYLKAKTAYQKDDMFSIYLICNDLEIDYEFSKEEEKEFKLTIKNLRNENAYVEQTYLWAWINEENEKTKNKILHHFISNSYRPR